MHLGTRSSLSMPVLHCKQQEWEGWALSVQWCLSWRMHRAKARQPGSVLLLLHVLHSWGSWKPEWRSALLCWALLRCLWGAHLQALSLRWLCLPSVLVISRNFGKRLKGPPSCCAGALWDSLGLFSAAVLGFIRLCRSTKLFFYLILFLSLTPKYFPVLPRTVEPIGGMRERISRQLKSLLLLNVTKLQSHLSASKLDQFCGVHLICHLLSAHVLVVLLLQ